MSSQTEPLLTAIGTPSMLELTSGEIVAALMPALVGIAGVFVIAILVLL